MLKTLQTGKRFNSIFSETDRASLLFSNFIPKALPTWQITAHQCAGGPTSLRNGRQASFSLGQFSRNSEADQLIKPETDQCAVGILFHRAMRTGDFLAPRSVSKIWGDLEVPKRKYSHPGRKIIVNQRLWTVVKSPPQKTDNAGLVSKLLL